MQTKEDRVTPSLFSLQISDSITHISKGLKINVAFSFHEFDSIYFTFTSWSLFALGLWTLLGNDLIRHLRGMLGLLQVAYKTNWSFSSRSLANLFRKIIRTARNGKLVLSSVSFLFTSH